MLTGSLEGILRAECSLRVSLEWCTKEEWISKGNESGGVSVGVVCLQESGGRSGRRKSWV